MTYKVYTTDTFEKEFSKLSVADQKTIQKTFLQLKENPYVGDQIRYRFFREKRIKEKRIYYLVYEDVVTVLVVAMGGKKAQQNTINEIIKLFPEFRKHIENLLD